MHLTEWLSHFVSDRENTMSPDTPREIDTKGSILFLGSGFSQGAKNIRNENLPTGHGLRDEFARLLGVDPNAYDLKTLADEISSRQDLNLYQTLYELFTVKELQPSQDDILQLPWRRIYTTNYDDAVELIKQPEVWTFGFRPFIHAGIPI